MKAPERMWVSKKEHTKILLELDGLMIQDKKVVGDSPIIALDKTSQTKLV